MNKWTKGIENISRDFESNFGDLSTEELNWKKNAQSWSIAQVIDHLTKVNQSYFPVFEKLVSGKYKAPFISKIGFLVSFFGNSIKKSVEPANLKKMKTFGLWQPQQTDFSAKTLEEFLQSQKILADHINASEHLINNKQVISSPVNRNIVYRLETAFDIILLHQQRHFNQAVQIREDLKKARTA